MRLSDLIVIIVSLGTGTLTYMVLQNRTKLLRNQLMGAWGAAFVAPFCIKYFYEMFRYENARPLWFILFITGLPILVYHNIKWAMKK